MTENFFRATRALALDTFRRSGVGLLLAGVLLGAWSLWFFGSRVSVYAVSSAARLQVGQAPFPLQAQVEGRVVAVHMAMGQRVKAGEVLVSLDDEVARLQREEEQARLESLLAELEVLRGEIQAEEAAMRGEEHAVEVEVEQARARHRAAQLATELASREARSSEQLFAAGYLAEEGRSRALSEARQREATAGALELEISRLEVQRRKKESERRALVERLRRSVKAREGAIAVARSTLRRLEAEQQLRAVRAPTEGVLAEVAPLQVGAVVHPGEVLATIVPEGEVIVVADFPPQAALGRIRPGQQARLRLDGFPWTQFGALPARVSRVAGEVRQGLVRVELEVGAEAPPQLPLQHGLPGVLEIEVDRVSPAVLALRAAGLRTSQTGGIHSNGLTAGAPAAP